MPTLVLLMAGHMMRSQEGKRSLSRLARDPRASAMHSAEIMVHDTTLGMVGGDAAGNVVVYNYMPRKLGASDELVVRADFHVGSMVRKMVCVAGHVTLST